MRTLGVAPLLVLLSAGVAEAQELSPRDIAARARPSVVMVSAVRDGNVVRRGSGFIVSGDGRLITNRHVIEGAESLRVQLSTGEIYDNVFFVSDDARRDLAILRIPDTGLPGLSIGDERTAAVGDPVYVFGNPLGLEGTFSDGLISAMRTVDGVSIVQITAPISPGSSGGPVFDARGEVIGVATRTLSEGQNLNMAVPARYAQGLLALNETPQPFAQIAARFSASESTSPASPASETPALEPWAQVLHDEMRVLKEAAIKLGYRPLFEPEIGMLEQGKTKRFELAFPDKGAEIKVIGACDSDCGDLDMGAYTLEGEEIIKDILDDDRPEIDFTITKPGTLRIVVYMAECRVDPCGFGFRAFVKE